MTPLVEVSVERQRFGAARVLRDDDLGAACIEIGDDPVTVESLVGDEATELDAVPKRLDTHRVEAMAWQKLETDEVAERVGEREDLGGHATFGAAYGLALSPPFAPWPWG